MCIPWHSLACNFNWILRRKKILNTEKLYKQKYPSKCYFNNGRSEAVITFIYKLFSQLEYYVIKMVVKTNAWGVLGTISTQNCTYLREKSQKRK